MIYYVDSRDGIIGACGTDPEHPVRNYRELKLLPGDTVLFKRGTVMRDVLYCVCGTDASAVSYGAYGVGEPPVFMGSINASSPEAWEETERACVWRCRLDIPTDVGNFIFNDDECTATLCWDEADLSHQGDFYDSRFAECNQNRGHTVSEQNVLLWSERNPGEYYSHIEIATYAERTLGSMCSNIVIEDITFMNGGVHGLTAVGETRGVVVRSCVFKNIGGCGWSRERRIRFGNGIEFWIGAEDVLIEGCTFKNIYDSCATHQGPDDKTPPAKNFRVRGNLFDTFSMAAFEYRAQMMIDSDFVGNVCKNAGCGFGMLGEPIPRRSEIYPLPMGHHIFLWRIWSAPEGGGLLIEGNTFENAPFGAHIYSIICPEAEEQITIGENTYIGDCLEEIHLTGEGGRAWTP